MNRYILTIFILPFLLMGCFNPPPEELERSVFIADDQYPELPAYTEWGYNTFGAHYNNGIFLYYTDYPVYAKVQKDTLTFEFYGGLKDINSDESLGIDFKLPGYHLTQYADLVVLHTTSFDLTSSTDITTLYVNGKKEKGTISNGQLEFKRAQYLLVNGQPDRVILSGYFNFQFLTDNNQTITVKNGRFDIGINEINFYIY